MLSIDEPKDSTNWSLVEWPSAPTAASCKRHKRILFRAEWPAGDDPELAALLGEPLAALDGGVPRPEAAKPPCLLGRTSLGEPVATTLKVKNTFIECVLSDDDDDGPPMMGVKSCPVDYMRSESTPTSPSLLLLRGKLGARPPVAVEAAHHRQGGREAEGEENEVVPLEVRKPQQSCGSIQHGTGLCRPCAWFWRPQGCANGRACRHCHLCSKGEVKARRRSKNSALRMQQHRTTR